MKSKAILLILLMISITFIGCKKKGCTDSDSLNYDSKAKNDDGSCTYSDSYHFSGAYSMSDNCTSGTGSYTMTIVANGNNNVIINNFGDSFNGVTASVSGKTITIPSQNGIVDKWGDTWDIDGGTGTLSSNNNTLVWSYSVDDILYGNFAGWVDCSGSGSK